MNQIDIIESMLPKELYLNLYLNLSGDNLAMLMYREATKSNAVLVVANKFNIFKNDIIAFGDDINDKERLLNAGLSVAVKNSIYEIKMLADCICDTNYNDGVTWLY